MFRTPLPVRLAAFLFSVWWLTNTLTAQSAPPAPRLLDVAVKNGKAGFVTDLEKDAFTVLVDGTPRQIFQFQSPAEPMSVAIIVDSSGSMGTGRLFSAAKFGVGYLMENSPAANEYSLVSFAVEAQVQQSWTTNHAQVIEALGQLKRRVCRKKLFEIRTYERIGITGCRHLTMTAR